ncbi:MAG TPA: hypothetical protein VF599_09820 [Pyrinomonadaceae bacterium]|jgi:hypothetical protein
MNKTIIFIGLILTVAAVSRAQVAQNGVYVLQQSITSSGGGTSTQTSSGGTSFSVTGAIGQTAAGTTLSNSPFTVKSGFFTPEPFAPTAASVSVSGRILTPEGNGLRNARVLLTDAQGNTRAVISSSFGYFRFVEIEVGQAYILTVASKRYQFAAQTLIVSEEIADLNLVAQ